MDETVKQAIYLIGVEWGKTHSQALASVSGNYADFEKLIHDLIGQESFLPDEVFTPVRVYNEYQRHPDEAEGYFVAGVWDALTGNASEGISVT